MRLERKLVSTLEEARDAVEELTRFGGTTLFQEFLSGRRESISFLYARGQIYARCAQWHTRIVGGQSSMRQSIEIQPQIGNQAEGLVREIELEGCSEVEFRYDNAGNPYLMEINPRLWSSTELAVRSGVDFPHLLYQWASGEEIDVVNGYRVGRRLRYLKGDIVYTVAALAAVGQSHWLERASPAKTVRDFCFSFFIPTAYDYADWKDPLPACRATAGFVREVVRRMGKGLSTIVRRV
jgi:predicted ATP-grasp superfamily ATP-dependent carboligase